LKKGWGRKNIPVKQKKCLSSGVHEVENLPPALGRTQTFGTNKVYNSFWVANLVRGGGNIRGMEHLRPSKEIEEKIERMLFHVVSWGLS